MMTNQLKIVVLLVLLAIFGAIVFVVVPSGRNREWSRMLKEREAATRLLAEQVAKRYPGKTALIIGNPLVNKRDRPRSLVDVEKAGVQGFKEGFGSVVKVEEVAHPELDPQFLADPQSRPIDPGSRTPLSYVVSDDSFDRLLDAHPECDILASLIGVPAHLKKTRFWNDPKGPHVALLLPDLRFIGTKEDIRTAFKSGKVTAVFYNPDARNEPKEEDRFIVLAADNIDLWLERNK